MNIEKDNRRIYLPSRGAPFLSRLSGIYGVNVRIREVFVGRREIYPPFLPPREDSARFLLDSELREYFIS